MSLHAGMLPKLFRLVFLCAEDLGSILKWRLRHMGKMLGVFALNVPILNSPYFDRSMIFCFDVFSLQLDQRQVFWL